MISNFCQGILETLQQFQEQELLIWPSRDGSGTSVTYTGKEIHNKVAATRDALESKGVQKGQEVLLAIPVGLDLICTILAVMAMGAIPVLPPAKTSKRSLLHLLFSRNIKAIVTTKAIPLPIKWGIQLFGIKLVTVDKVPNNTVKWVTPAVVSPDQAALISHSSGSTGRPKAIIRSHRVLQAQHLVLKEIFPPWRGQRDFPLFPNILLHNLSIGTTSILPDLPWADITQLNLSRVAEQIRCNRIDSMTGNIFYFEKLYSYLNQEQLTLPTVKALGIGGSPITERLVHDLKGVFPQAAVYIIYGSSEAEPIAVRQISSERKEPQLGYAVGDIHPSLEYKIESFGEVVLKDGNCYTVGEIKVKGAHVAVQTKDTWLSTGDFGYLDKENLLYLTGRKGNEKLHSGVQHYQLEHVLLHQSGVEKAAAKSMETGFDLYVEGSASEEAIVQALLPYFPASIIHNIFFRQSLPVDARHHSKILYSNLV